MIAEDVHDNMRTMAERAPKSTSQTESLPIQQNSAFSLEEIIQDSLEDAKAEDIVSIDLTHKSSMGDLMIIASGRSHRHVGAIADQLVKKIKTSGYGKAHVEGLANCDWVLIDTGDVIVHIFRPEVRDFYNLEKMWSADRPNDASGEIDDQLLS